MHLSLTESFDNSCNFAGSMGRTRNGQEEQSPDTSEAEAEEAAERARNIQYARWLADQEQTRRMQEIDDAEEESAFERAHLHEWVVLEEEQERMRRMTEHPEYFETYMASGLIQERLGRRFGPPLPDQNEAFHQWEEETGRQIQGSIADISLAADGLLAPSAPPQSEPDADEQPAEFIAAEMERRHSDEESTHVRAVALAVALEEGEKFSRMSADLRDEQTDAYLRRENSILANRMEDSEKARRISEEYVCSRPGDIDVPAIGSFESSTGEDERAARARRLSATFVRELFAHWESARADDKCVFRCSHAPISELHAPPLPSVVF
eukprot:24819_1